MAGGSTVRDLRQRNRARVLRHVVLTDETTRARLTAACRLSSATITNVINDLIADGLVQETGHLPSDGGRPMARLSARPQGAYVIGVDVSEHGVLVELFDLTFQVVDRMRHDVQGFDGGIDNIDNVGSALSEAVQAIRARNSQPNDALIGVGLGLPGLVERDGDGRTTFSADGLGWPATDLAELCNINDLPIYADNGAKTLTVAEQWFGAARDLDHAIVVLVGSGISAGVISDGLLLRGTSNTAGEWGHTKVELNGRACKCGDRGCLEAYVGGAAVAARWREEGSIAGSEEDVVVGLVEAAGSGDPAATAVLDETVALLATGLANLVNLFNPSKIVVGGWAGLAMYAARGHELAEAVRHRSLRWPGRHVTVEPCALGGDATALGAALLPLERLIGDPFKPPPITATLGTRRDLAQVAESRIAKV